MRPWKLRWADVRQHRGWWAGGAVVALLVVALAVAEIAGWPFLAGPAQRALERQLGVPVQIEAPFALHLIGRPRLQLGSLRVGAAAQSSAPFLLDADRVELRWRWADLWRYRQGQTLRIARLQAGRLEAHLQRNDKGEASWQLKPRSDGDSVLALPRIDVLRVADGVVHVDDAPLELRLEVTAHLDENQKDAAAVGLFVTAEGSYRGAPAKGKAHAAAPLELAGADADDAAQPITVDVNVGATTLAFDGRVADLWGTRSFEGSLKLNGPSLAAVGAPFGITLPTTSAFALRGHLARDDGVWRLDAYDATVGRSRVNGEFSFDTRPKLPLLTGTLRGQRLALADLGPAIGAPAAASAPAAAASSGRHVLPQRSFDLPSLRQMDAHVAVALDELDLGTTALDTFRPLKAKLALESGVLSLTGIETRTAGGSLTGSTQLDGNKSPAAWRADVRWQGVDLAGWIKGVRTGDAKVNGRSAAKTLAREREAALENTEPVHAYITGEMRGEANVTGRGNSTAQILSTLDGTVRATLRDGTLSHLAVEVAGIDVAQAIGVAVRGDRSLPLSCAVVALRARSGVLTPEVAVFDTPDSTITAQGQIDLRNEQLDLRAIVHPKDFSFFSLRSPLLVQGKFSAPTVRLEAGPLAGRLLAGTALAVVNPLAALAAFVDPGDDGTTGCAEVARRAARQAERAPPSTPTKTTITRSSP